MIIIIVILIVAIAYGKLGKVIVLTRSIVEASVKNDYRIVNIKRHYLLVLFITMYWILLIILMG